jgi:hypothetical protein
MDLPLRAADHRQRFAEVDLRVSRVVAQRHEHLALPLAALVHVVLYNSDPAAIAVLIPQPLEDPLRGVLLLRRLSLILLQDPIDDPDVRVQLRPRRRPAPPVSRRHRERQHLGHRPWVDPESPRCFAPAQPLNINRSSHLPIQFRAFHPSAFNPPG